jgi:hypothetical protein
MSDDNISGNPRPAADQSEPSQSPLDHHISLYDTIRGKAPRAELSLREWLHNIRDGQWRKQVLAVRELYGDAAAYKTAKAKLPCVTACGTFTTHEAANLQRHNQTVHADVDHGLDGHQLTPEQIQQALDHLRHDPTVVYAFIGPSGHGIKYGVHIPEVTTNQAYRHAWGVVSADHRERYGLVWDESAKDVSRLCFCSYDPACHINPDEPTVFPIPAPAKQPPRQPRNQSPSTPDRERVEDALRHIPSEDREVWLRIGMALHSTEEPWARDVWDDWSRATTRENYLDRDQEETWTHLHADGKVQLGTLFELAKQHGWQDARRVRNRSPQHDHRKTPAMTPAADSGDEQLATGDEATGDVTAQEQLAALTAKFLERLKATPEQDQLRLIRDHMRFILGKLDAGDWIVCRGEIKAIMKNRVRVEDLEKMRSGEDKAARQAKALAGGMHFIADLMTGLPKDVLANAFEVLTQDPEWIGLLAFDELRGSAMLMQCPPWRLPSPEAWEPRAVTDEDCTEACNYIQRIYEGFTPKTPLIAEAINAVSRRHAYHEIRDYLHGLVWDGKPRLDTWLVDYCHVEDTPYTRAVGRITLLGAVARVLLPGCKLDTMVILIGEQGWLKSSVFRVLAGDRWFSDTPIDLRSKDAYQMLKGKWFVEFQEMTTLGDSDINRLKGYLSSPIDNYRDSYGRLSRSHPRQNVFCGTSNRQDIFKDETGNRRFHPVQVHAPCEVEALQQDRDQIWAETMHYYHMGERWYLDKALEKTAAAVQDQFLETGAWEDLIMAFLRKRGFYRVTADYLLEHAIKAPIFQRNGQHYKHIARIMG